MADRPASRGGALALSGAGIPRAPTGMAPERPERPMTASRQATPSGRPPSAASSFAAGAATGPPPGTAYRRMLGAAGATATGTAASARLGLLQGLEARPLTQQGGLGGAGQLLRPGTQASGGRQVLDRAYFVALLHQKRQEVARAVAELQASGACSTWSGPGVGPGQWARGTGP